MNRPFVIWTLRRTGGSTLVSLLRERVGAHRLLAEPFNPNREFSELTTSFKATQDKAALLSGIRAALDGSVSLKQCIDVLPFDVHDALLQVTRDLGYRSLVLDRRDDSARVLSLLLAQQTKAWGRASARDIYPDIASGARALKPFNLRRLETLLHRGRARREGLCRLFSAAGLAPPVVFYEDLYDCRGGSPTDAAGPALALRLLRHLGAASDEGDALDGWLHERLGGSAQHSQTLYAQVPNIAEARRALSAAPHWRNPFLDLPTLS
ncbi:MAG: hypothetical protein AAGG09_21040 [Pseudomonadota bacterium]